MSMSLEELIREVVNEAFSQYEKSIDQALEEGLSRLRQHKSETMERLKNELTIIAREARIEAVKRIGQAELDAKRRYLQAIEELVESVIKESIERVKELKNSETYEKSLEVLMRGAVEAIGGRSFRITCSEDDRERVARVARRIEKEMSVEFSIEPVSLKTIGGIRIMNKEGTVQLDNTIESRLERLRSEIRTMIIKELMT